METAEFFIWPKLFLAKAALGKAALGGLAFSKTVQINTAPAPVVKYSYKPVTYTAYKWVPVPYQVRIKNNREEFEELQSGEFKSDMNGITLISSPLLSLQYTVQKPYIDTSSSSATLTTSTSTQAESKPISAPFASGNLAVRAPFVNVDVVKTAGTYSVNTGRSFDKQQGLVGGARCSLERPKEELMNC